MSLHFLTKIGRPREGPKAEVPTLVLDAVIDSFFLIDILVTFNTGIIVSGEYIDSRMQVQV